MLLTMSIQSESKAGGKKAQKASGDVCVLYDITVTLKIKISQIIGLDWWRKREGETGANR